MIIIPIPWPTSNEDDRWAFDLSNPVERWLLYTLAVSPLLGIGLGWLLMRI